MGGLGIVAAAVMLTLLLFNGLAMLVSPSWWFDLPSYLAFRGSLRREAIHTLSGQLQVRILGFIFSTFVVYAASMLLGGESPPNRDGTSNNGGSATVALAVGLVASIAGVVLGSIMALRPTWYFEHMLRPKLPERRSDSAAWWVWPIRILGIIPLFAGSYMAWICVHLLFRL
jgi:hypothetical protein